MYYCSICGEKAENYLTLGIVHPALVLCSIDCFMSLSKLIGSIDPCDRLSWKENEEKDYQ